MQNNFKLLFENWNNFIEESRASDLKQKYPTYARLIDDFEDADPSPKKRYIKWMIDQYIKSEKENKNIEIWELLINKIQKISDNATSIREIELINKEIFEMKVRRNAMIRTLERQQLTESISSKSKLYPQLMRCRKQMAIAAQQVYDEWEQDEDGYDEMLGSGGICQDIADAILNVIANHVEIEHEASPVSPSCGEQHVWCVVWNDQEVWHVDIPYSTYETGGGYNWKKRPDVEFDENDIQIFKGSHDDIPGDNDY